MPNHDFVSGSLLALTAGGIALRCAALLQPACFGLDLKPVR